MEGLLSSQEIHHDPADRVSLAALLIVRLMFETPT
jgi:hypothetical protein